MVSREACMTSVAGKYLDKAKPTEPDIFCQIRVRLSQWHRLSDRASEAQTLVVAHVGFFESIYRDEYKTIMRGPRDTVYWSRARYVRNMKQNLQSLVVHVPKKIVILK